MLTRVDPFLDRPVILFQDVFEVLHGAVLAVVGQIACRLEHGNGRRITGVLVGVDDPRVRMVRTAQGFGQKALSGCCIAFSPREGSRSSHRWSPPPVQVHPLALSPGCRSRPPANCRWSVGAAVAIGAEFPGRNVGPPPDGDVVGVQAPLGQQLLDVTVRQ
jgi:hypothetical protein